MTGMADAGSVRKALSGANVVCGRLASEATLAQVVENTAEFVSINFFRRELSGYKAWRRARGYEFLGRKKLIETYRMDAKHAWYFGRGTTPEDSTEELFDRCWRHSETVGNAAAIPIAVCANPLGAEIGFLNP